MGQAVMRAMVKQTKLPSLGPPLPSCCVAWLLTGRGPVPACGPGIGDPYPNARSALGEALVQILNFLSRKLFFGLAPVVLPTDFHIGHVPLYV